MSNSHRSLRTKLLPLAAGLLAGSLAPVFLQPVSADPPAARGRGPARITTDSGAPVGEVRESLSAGPNGPVLLQDWNLLQRLARFDRERIPERVVHARGTGAFGYFESSSDEHALTRAQFLARPGVRTPVAVRFSTVIHPSGSPETLRDPRGFAVKLYTQEGNYDIVGNHIPVFFIRDAIRFPDMVHSLKPSPITNRQDPNRVFAFMSETPESTHMLTWLYSDHGTPANYREMDGFGVHAYVWVNAEGQRTYVRYHWRSAQGVRTLSPAEAQTTQGQDFQHATTDLYAAIRRGEFPAWDLYVQTIRPDQLDDFDFNPLDSTRSWPEARIPARRVGRMVLNRLPTDYFAEVEQLAFSPGVMVPGVEPSEDHLLQGRLFSYADTQRYRLGTNYLDIAVNRPLVPVANHQEDGAFATTRTGDVNFYPSAGLEQPLGVDSTYRASAAPLTATTTSQLPNGVGSDFAQAGELYRSFTPALRDHLIDSLAGDLAQVRSRDVVLRMLSHFHRADAEYGRRLAERLQVPLAEVERASARLPE